MVNIFGKAVQSTITTGDHYRKRHDAYKMQLFQMYQWAGLEAEVEVFNLLAGFYEVICGFREVNCGLWRLSVGSGWMDKSGCWVGKMGG